MTSFRDEIEDAFRSCLTNLGIGLKTVLKKIFSHYDPLALGLGCCFFSCDQWDSMRSHFITDSLAPPPPTPLPNLTSPHLHPFRPTSVTIMHSPGRNVPGVANEELNWKLDWKRSANYGRWRKDTKPATIRCSDGQRRTKREKLHVGRDLISKVIASS